MKKVELRLLSRTKLLSECRLQTVKHESLSIASLENRLIEEVELRL